MGKIVGVKVAATFGGGGRLGGVYGRLGDRIG